MEKEISQPNPGDAESPGRRNKEECTETHSNQNNEN